MANLSMSNDAFKAPSHTLKAFHLLGLTPSMSLEDDVLEAAFRKQQLSLHPDRQSSPTARQAENSFAQVVEAYETLKNIKTRAKILFQSLGLWPAPHDLDVLEELLELEEAWQEGQVHQNQLSDMIEEAFAALCHHFDAKHYQAAGTHFMRLCALKRMHATHKI